MIYAYVAQGATTAEDRAQLDRALGWPVDQDKMRATWGETADAEQAQAAMMALARRPTQ